MIGYTSHNLLAADVVTADGRLIRASEDENADLFWGLRGGGGNFGVVTQFEYRLHEVGPTVAGGMVLWPMEQAADVLRFYRDWIASAPDEVGGGAAVVVAPPEEFVPAPLQGKPVFAVIPISFGMSQHSPVSAAGTVVTPFAASMKLRFQIGVDDCPSASKA